MPRLSRGCFRCRQRKVKCDGGRPSCQRCIGRNEACIGYRDESDLIFRYETEKVVSNARRNSAASKPSHSSTLTSRDLGNLPSPGSSPECAGNNLLGTSAVSPRSSEHTSLYTNVSQTEFSASSSVSSPSSPPRLHYLHSPPLMYPWLKPELQQRPEPEEQAVAAFFDRYVVSPCSHRSTPGFLEHLPSLFKEVNVDGRHALRWAVKAAAFADASRNAGPSSQLGMQAMHCYGEALKALGQSLGEKGKVPDDYDLMAVVVLDIFETLFLTEGSRGAHAQGMAHILRLRGHEQFHSPRGWGLFRLAHHRLQKEQLAFKLSPMPESQLFLDQLNDQLSFVHLEKDTLQIATICQRARDLLQEIDQRDMSATELIKVVREMHALDETAVAWRRGPEWAFRTANVSELITRSERVNTVVRFPTVVVELHPDIWNAYEWNYHRTARILLHEQLLSCLHRMASDGSDADAVAAGPLELESTTIIRSLADKILATVPQMLGDIDDRGVVVDQPATPQSCRAIGAYMLLWPIKIIKGSKNSAFEEQRAAAKWIFERIREYTGMRSLLGELSNI